MSIALIPARGGSKRIPKKNIREFCGKPMIAHSIQAAIESGCFERVVVSTDDQEIASIACAFGAEVPFTRPSHLSDDFATTMSVIQHAIAELVLDPNELLCCLYATAPFVTVSDLVEAKSLLLEDNLKYVFTAAEYASPIQRAFYMNEQNFCQMFQPQHVNTRSQDLPSAFFDAGQFYIGHVSAFVEGQHFFNSDASRPIVLPSFRVQDIDTLDDWARAEVLYRVLQEQDHL